MTSRRFKPPANICTFARAIKHSRHTELTAISMLAAGARCALPCHVLRRHCRQPLMATAAEAPGAGAALMHSEVAVRVKDQDRLQLDVEAKIGIPRSIYESVRVV